MMMISLWKAVLIVYFFFQAEDGIRDADVTGVQTCALPIYLRPLHQGADPEDGRRRGSQEPAHRPANRGDVRAARGEDRAPHGRQVPRSAGHPPGPHPQAGVSLATQAVAPAGSGVGPAKYNAEKLRELA